MDLVDYFCCLIFFVIVDALRSPCSHFSLYEKLWSWTLEFHLKDDNECYVHQKKLFANFKLPC